MCGEKAAKQAALIKAYGITPACAGKSFPAVLHFGLVEDHPRVCGEKSDAVSVPAFALGSPPRVRGKEGGYYFDAPGLGITPACAGKSHRRLTPLYSR